MRRHVLQTAADYTPVDVVSPLDGTVITMYNISKAAISHVSYLDSTDPNFKQWYNGFEFSADVRLPPVRSYEQVDREIGGTLHPSLGWFALLGVATFLLDPARRFTRGWSASSARGTRRDWQR